MPFMMSSTGPSSQTFNLLQSRASMICKHGLDTCTMIPRMADLPQAKPSATRRHKLLQSCSVAQVQQSRQAYSREALLATLFRVSLRLFPQSQLQQQLRAHKLLYAEGPLQGAASFGRDEPEPLLGPQKRAAWGQGALAPEISDLMISDQDSLTGKLVLLLSAA